MSIFDRDEESGWFEVSDENGQTTVMRPIATIVSNGRVYSLMGAVRTNEQGEDEGGLVLVRQSSLLHKEGTRYEVVGDEGEVERVMSRVMAALLSQMQQGADQPANSDREQPRASSPREFSVCDMDEFLQ